MNIYKTEYYNSLSNTEFEVTLRIVAEEYKMLLADARHFTEVNFQKMQHVRDLGEDLGISHLIDVGFSKCRHCMVESEVALVVWLRKTLCDILIHYADRFSFAEFKHLVEIAGIPTQVYDCQSVRKVEHGGRVYYIYGPLVTEDYKQELEAIGVDTSKFGKSGSSYLRKLWNLYRDKEKGIR